ncbi:hypothetical protein [Sorangium sp. So ce341]
MIDVLYLDAFHHLTHAVHVQQSSALKLECAVCEQRFLAPS